MAYKEVKMGKGDAQAIFGNFNDNFVPKGYKDKHAKDNTKKTADKAKTGSKKPKIH